MLIYQKPLEFHTKGRSIIDITDSIDDIVKCSNCNMGICNVFIQHTSASLVVCENADPAVRKDVERFTQRWIPDGDPIFKHVLEGPDDMPAHLRAMLTLTSLSIPINRNKLLLGTWQGIYLWEHRTARFRRKIIVTAYGTE